MTYDEAVAVIVMRTPLTADDIGDLLDAAGDPGALATLVRVYDREGRAPDRSHWQTFADVLGQVAGVAQKVAPIVSVVMALAPLL